MSPFLARQKSDSCMYSQCLLYLNGHTQCTRLEQDPGKASNEAGEKSVRTKKEEEEENERGEIFFDGVYEKWLERRMEHAF